jgi:hypothetical protein
MKMEDSNLLEKTIVSKVKFKKPNDMLLKNDADYFKNKRSKIEKFKVW